MSIPIWSLIVLDERPRPWSRPRPRFRGRGFITPWKNYHLIIERDAKASKPDAPLEGPLELSVVFSFKRPKSMTIADRLLQWFLGVPDLDNLVKGIGDKLEAAGVVKNDSNFVRLVAEKRREDFDTTLIQIRRLDP